MINTFHIMIADRTRKVTRVEDEVKSGFARENMIKNPPKQNFMPIMKLGVPEKVRSESKGIEKLDKHF